jgi:hypothetical protein
MMRTTGRVDRTMNTVARRRGAVALACSVIAAIAGCLVYVVPNAPRNGLWQAAVWAVLMLVAFYGWGGVAHRLTLPARPVDSGLRMVWGASVMAFMGGSLGALSLFSRPVAVGLMEMGAIAAAGVVAGERQRLARRATCLLGALRKNYLFGLLALLFAVGVLVLFLGAVSDPARNPYDDDVAYLALAQKFLQTGTFIEPFSSRRLTAYGGQSFFQAVLLVRCRFDQANTFDHGVALIMSTALIVGHPARGTRGAALLKFLVLAMVLTLPRVGVNTASYYSGLAFFLGLYRTLRWLPLVGHALWRLAVLPALVGAGACTLRHSYLVPAVGVLVVSYLALLVHSSEPLRRRCAELATAAGCFIAAMVPWWYLAFRSNRTFLYPLVSGLGNPALSFKSTSMSSGAELRYLMWCLIDSEPIRTLPVFVLASVWLADRSPRRGLHALWLASGVGYVALAHQVTQADPYTLSRYAFGYVTALVVAVVLAVASREVRGPKLGGLALPTGMVVAAAIFEISMARKPFAKLCDTYVAHAEERSRRAPESEKTQPFEKYLYQRVQETIPAGERIAVMVDDPYYLDFARNEIFNLDVPGASSLPPGLPYFEGAEPLAAYFLSNSIRYVVFVRHSFSRFLYGRELWIQQVAGLEVWQTAGPYMLALIEAFPVLSTKTKVLFEERGIVVLDLKAGSLP